MKRPIFAVVATSHLSDPMREKDIGTPIRIVTSEISSPKKCCSAQLPPTIVVCIDKNKSARLTSERGHVCLDPFQCKPLVFEPVVSLQLVFFRSKKPECRETVADVYPYLVPLRRDVLGLGSEGMGRAKLEET